MNITNINELVGARIRLARKARGLSVKELANRCGVHANTLEHYERGQMSPKFDITVSIARELGVTTDWLAGRRVKNIELIRKLESDKLATFLAEAVKTDWHAHEWRQWLLSESEER